MVLAMLRCSVVGKWTGGAVGAEREYCGKRRSLMVPSLDLSRIYAALIAHLGCLAFESQGAFASQR